MSLTSDMKDELARTPVSSQAVMAAEVAALLRFAGGLHLVGGRILIEAELDSSVAVRRLRAFLTALYNVESLVVVVSGSSLRRGKRYVVRVVQLRLWHRVRKKPPPFGEALSWLADRFWNRDDPLPWKLRARGRKLPSPWWGAHASWAPSCAPRKYVEPIV